MKYNGLLNAKDSIQVLFLGNSHANYSVNPCMLEDFIGYNIANVSQQIYFDKRLTIKAINEGVRNLKYVFISVDYHSLFTSSQGVRDIWSYYANGIKYKNKDYIKSTVSPFIWGYTPKVSLSLIKKRVLNTLKYRNDSIINFNVENGVNITDHLCGGFIGLEGLNNYSFNNLSYKKKASNFKENINKSERVEVIKDLNSFILFLKNKNIEPVLFSSPTYREYNKYLDKKQIKRNIEDIDNICQKYNIQYWRFNEDCRFLKKDFYNQDHLNKKGASKFSIILNKKLKMYDKLRMHNNK
ncbi:hypothetical protein ACT3CE_05925 [Marinifilum sp. RC60d5]|uniref:hypothetical protein n=1 Tax=Marinifilum sp. RC60d5 TaxID=3458414 RepID=UPI0040350FF0